ncbi:hypothetical protein WDW86_01720 [Bdellovibrionota bacterium FG-2]
MNTTSEVKLFGTRWIALLALGASVLLSSGLTTADETPDAGARMGQFFSQIQGEWAATGMLSFLKPYGGSQKIRYSMDMKIMPTQDSTWHATLQILTETGELRRNAVEFKIQGDRLFVGDSLTRESVDLLESSSTKLNYQITRFDRSGHEVHYVYGLELNEKGKLIGHNFIETEESVVQEDDFLAKQN